MSALPTLGDYQGAMQNPGLTLADPVLRSGSTVLDPMGMPKVVSGGFALTYQVQTTTGRYAVRCFHRLSADLAARYAAIQPVVAARPGTFVAVEYQQAGIRVLGKPYPLLKMPWIDGQQLGTYLRRNLTPAALDRVEAGLVSVQKELEGAGIAHGDIQHGNVLVASDGSLRLIDYDGMYVPALAGRAATEAGHVNYQHPLRTNQFGPTLDRFPVMTAIVALRALKERPGLWDRFSNDENILFTRRDLVDPATSPLFAELKRISAVAPLAERLARIAIAPFVDVPTIDRFLSGEFAVVARSATATRPAITSQYQVVNGADREALLRLEGSVVTVVGRIVDFRISTTRTGQPYAFLNFGNFKTGAFTVVLWAEALANRIAQVRALRGALVQLTGLVTVYREFDPPKPQMVAESITSIQRLDEDTARQLLSSGSATAAGDIPTVGISARAPAHHDDPLAALGIDPEIASNWGAPLGPPPVRQDVSPRQASVTQLSGPMSQVPGVNTPRARRPAPPPNVPVATRPPVAAIPHPPAVRSQPAPASTAKPGASAPRGPAPGRRSATPSLQAGIVVAALVIVAAAIWFLMQQS
jgi:hypothetical protein